MHEPIPQELVDMIIDDVGGGRGRVHRPPLKGDDHASDVITYEALKSCALVARSWTHRSRMNLFEEIVLKVDGEEGISDLVLPPPASLQFVKFLEIYLNPSSPHRDPMTMYLLSAFSACPLEFLQIDGGLFSLSGRPALQAFFDALSGRLLGITFRFCIFEPEPLRDILSIQDTKANVMFLGCDQEHPDDPAREDVDWELVCHTPRRKLCVMGTEERPSEEFLIDLSELSVVFFRLEVDFYESGELVDATQRLIDANSGALSFLKLNVISYTPGTLHGSTLLCSSLTLKPVDISDDAELLLPPSLSSCVNLSELVLNMKGSYSCVVETPGAIFASLLAANCPNLYKITLEVEEARALFLAGTREYYLGPWNELDTTLTMLAEKLMNMRGRKLIFVVEVTCEDDTVHRAKKWLPRFLPMFHQAGLLHVHHGEDDVCYGRHHKAEDVRACMGRAVLGKYAYESENDEEPEETGAAKGGAESKEDQDGGSSKGRREGGEDQGLDQGNEGDDEGEEQGEENE